MNDRGTRSEAEDRAAIAEVLARYAVALDSRNFGDLFHCFTEDALVEYAGVRLAPGVDAVIEHVKGLADMAASQHNIGTISVDVDGDRARAMSYAIAHLVRVSPGGHDVAHRGLSYEDELTRTSEGWRIARRTHRVHWMTEATASGPVEPVPTRSELL
ncbi:MAG TPA: nuclear transport factor 2 family protein [Acidimicrobiales bacterium]|nr:nuclear transport factor 2 family protein [Acidimicrobiales bacterium]